MKLQKAIHPHHICKLCHHQRLLHTACLSDHSRRYRIFRIPVRPQNGPPFPVCHRYTGQWYNLYRLLMLSLLSHGQGYHKYIGLPSRWHMCSLRDCRSLPHNHGWLPPFRQWIRSFCCRIRKKYIFSLSLSWWKDAPQELRDIENQIIKT